MWRIAALFLVCAPLPVAPYRLGGRQSAVTVDESSAWREAELSDNHFWTAQWHTLEAELLQLQKAVGGPQGFLQLGNATTKANVTAKKAVAANKTSVHLRQNISKAEMDAKSAAIVARGAVVKANLEAVHDKTTERLDEVNKMTKGLAGKAMLAPMLGMLEGLYQDQKERIGQLNKKEEESKKRYNSQKSDFDKRLQAVQDHIKKGGISKEFGANQTRDYTHQFKYWEGVRTRAHRQFHNSLKITHGLMSKEKDTITQYKKALAGPDQPDAAAASKTSKPAAKEEMPDVDLVQKSSALAGFCREALLEVRQELRSDRRVM